MYNTPQAADNFSRYMVEAFDDREIITVPTGFQAFFGRPESNGKTKFSPDALTVDIDILRGNEKIAPLIHRNSPGRIVSGQKNAQEQKYSSFSRVYPLIEEESDLNAAQILKRIAGEPAYSSMMKLDRMKILAMNEHLEHVRRIGRTFEVLSSESIRTGKMSAIIGTTNTSLQYDFRRNAAHTITPAAKWDVITTDIIGDVDTGCALIRVNGKVEPDMLIMGGGAMEAFIKNTTVKELADNRRIELIEVSTNFPVPDQYARFIQAGFKARGRLRTPQGYVLWMFTYIGKYTDASGTTQDYMPTNQAVLASSMARCDRYFGPAEVLPKSKQDIEFYQEYFGFNPLAAPMPMNIKDGSRAILPQMFYCDAYRSSNQKTVSIRTQAAPIYATTMTDAFLTFINVLT